MTVQFTIYRETTRGHETQFVVKRDGVPAGRAFASGKGWTPKIELATRSTDQPIKLLLLEENGEHAAVAAIVEWWLVHRPEEEAE